MHADGVASENMVVPEFQDFHRASVGRFVEAVAKDLPAGSLVLDAGAGEGMYRRLFNHTRYLAFDYGIGDAGWDYTGLDVVCDLHLLPLKDRSVPYILCTQTLEHLTKPHVALSELYRVLSDNGTIFCTLPFIGDAHHQEPYDFFRYTKYADEYLFAQAGFRDIEISPIGGYGTLLVSLMQKGVYRFMENNRTRPVFVRDILLATQRVAFFFLRGVNRIAWACDRKDAQRYRFALGFTVKAHK